MNARTEQGALRTAATGAALEAMFARAWGALRPPKRLSLIEWAETFRKLSPEESNIPGDYSLEHTPALRGILAAISERGTRKVVAQKSAQVGWTAGVPCNVIGYHMHWRPSIIVGLFPRAQSAKDFASEKMEPMIRATPALAERVPLKIRAPGTGTTRRKFPGGVAKLVASNSPGDVKSTSARVAIVEEPDDVSTNVRGQGNAIALAFERVKTFAPDELQVIGGTPTLADSSLIVKEMRTTDQRYFMAPCHDCGEVHSPVWDNVVIPGLRISDEDARLPAAELDSKWPKREVYGRARWEDAYYACPHCGSIWDDDQRIENIRTAARVPPLYGWQPTASSSTPGFYLNELLSVFDGSRVPELAKKYLVALFELEAGDPEKMVAFWNSTLGLPWSFTGELPKEDELRARSEPYEEWSTPVGGVLPVMFVDVQHDRLAVEVWTIGRGEEMWLAYWGEVYGRTIESHRGAWLELDALLDRTVKHPSGAQLHIAAVAIDSGDGQTADAVYDYVRAHRTRSRPVIATKGASDSVGKVEIWTKPKALDPTKKAKTKAAKKGTRVYTIGQAKAKDLLLGWAQNGGRLQLTGDGPGRLHWYEGVRPDFFTQVLAEVKVPGKRNQRIREWAKKAKDAANEALDCMIGCLWLSRHLKLHLMTPKQWDALERRQLREVVAAAKLAAAAQPSAPSARPSARANAETPAMDATNAPDSATIPDDEAPQPATAAPETDETPPRADEPPPAEPQGPEDPDEAPAAAPAPEEHRTPAAQPHAPQPSQPRPRRRIRGRLGGGWR